MIESIQKQIDDEYNKRKISPYIHRLNLSQMLDWSDHTSKKYGLNKKKFEEQVKDIFWGNVALHLNMGHIFIALSSSTETGGKERSMKGFDIPENYGFAEIHCWYHLSNGYESVYRLWERLVSVLIERFTPASSKNVYFVEYAKFMKAETIIFEKEADKLKPYFKHWMNISSKRNETSHGNFNPFKKMEINVKPSGMASPDQKTGFVTSYKFPNFKQEVNTLSDSIEKTFDLINTVIDLCALEIQPNKKIKLDNNKYKNSKPN